MYFSLLSYKYRCIQNNILNLELSFLVRSQILKSSSSSIVDFHKLKKDMDQNGIFTDRRYMAEIVSILRKPYTVNQ